MKTKIITAFIAATLLMPVSSQAATLKNKTIDRPTIAILDTALDTSLPIFNGKIAYEVCVLQWNSCPNGTSFQEGPGSSTLPAKMLAANGFDHGTQMASLAVAANPNVNIVFIRIIGNDKNGYRQPAGESTLTNALDWVVKNKAKFNIQAVSMSQGNHVFANVADYCPKTPSTEAKINELLALEVPVFVPAGNDRDYVRIDWPACIPSAMAIGATMPTNDVAIYSNFDAKLVDFFALGTTKATTVGGASVNIAGTSASVPIAATQWATVKSAKSYLTYQQMYDLISKTSIPTKNSKVAGGKLINLQGALNG